MDPQAVGVERTDGVLTVRLERPEVRNGLVKRLLLVAASADLSTATTVETIAQSLLIGTDDHREGRAAVRELRPPGFRGR